MQIAFSMATLGNNESGTIDEAAKVAAQDFVPAQNAEYGTKRYWEWRFRKEDSYEWLGGFEIVKEHVLNKILAWTATHADRPNIDLLVIGCGNSRFSFELAEALKEFNGFGKEVRITSIDFAQTVIEKMSKMFPDLDWKVEDMTDMVGFEENSFDFALDKAAMDALVTDEGDPWNPNEKTVQNCSRMMSEMCRVVRPGGYFLQLSFQQPHFRRKYLSPQNVELVEATGIDYGLGYFFYELAIA